jgi:hypothetical protein
LWKCSTVEGFRTIAEGRMRAGRMKRVHKAAMIRSAGHKWVPACARDSRSAADVGPARIRQQQNGARPVWLIGSR